MKVPPVRYRAVVDVRCVDGEWRQSDIPDDAYSDGFSRAYNRALARAYDLVAGGAGVFRNPRAERVAPVPIQEEER